MIKPQIEFPLLARYKEKFKITSRTIFAYNGNIYCDYPLTNDLLIHERTHLEQQQFHGLEYWVENFLNNKEFRLKVEVEAYRQQLKSISNKQTRFETRQRCSKDLSSDLYKLNITYNKAFNLLK